MTLEEIVAYLDGAAQTVGSLEVPTISAGAKVADLLIKVIQSAIKAHNAVTGQPLDLNLLQPIDKVE